MEISQAKMTHLKQLEAESIHIIREVAAEFDNPVMLYSIGKDSAVMLHLAMKALYPAKPPFPLMHVDTTWKFKEMIEFRNRIADKYGMDLIVHTNQKGKEENINPFDHGSSKYTDVMKTQGLIVYYYFISVTFFKQTFTTQFTISMDMPTYNLSQAYFSVSGLLEKIGLETRLGYGLHVVHQYLFFYH